MRYRKLDANGDMRFGNQQADYWIDSPEGVAQSVVTRLKLFAGEWFLDIDEGTAWQAGVLGKHSLQNASDVIRERIMDTDGVTELIDFSIVENRETRTIGISAIIETIFGQATINEVL